MRLRRIETSRQNSTKRPTVLSTVIMYRNMCQSELNERGEEDTVLVAKMFIVCRFANSIFTSLRLACMGLILGATTCLKTAFEALQYGRLISLDQTFAASFMDPNGVVAPGRSAKASRRDGP
jgi:hypothetical protein